MEYDESIPNVCIRLLLIMLRFEYLIIIPFV